jgi:hypothetical protein
MQNIKYITLLILSITLILLYIIINNNKYKNLDYTKDIKPVIRKKCTPCHNPNGTAPFNLITKNDFYNNAPMISYVVENRIMPQWLADHKFSLFKNQRVLTDKEIKKITSFIKNNKNNNIINSLNDSISYEKINKVKIECDTIIELSMQDFYQIKGDNKDRLINFYLPSQFNIEYWLKGIELISTNKKLVHHAWLFQSKKNNSIVDNLEQYIHGVEDVLDNWTKFDILYGYLPGFGFSYYSDNLSKLIRKNSKIFLQIHYYSTPFPQQDKTKVRLYLNKKPSKHILDYLIIHEDYLNKELKIPKNKKRKFKGIYTLKKNVALYSVIPHMHFRGKSITAWAILPNKVRINLIRINDWNFNNQEIYIFKNIIKLPRDTKIKFVAEFDNTKNNPNNPILPPVDIQMGNTSKDEMLQLIFEYYNY